MNRRRLRKAAKRLKNLPGGLNFVKYGLNKTKGAWYKATGSTKVAYPSSIMLEVTNHCNLRCITCAREYDFGHAMAKGFMPIDKLKNIVDEAYPYVDSIGLTGLGETLLYKQLSEAVDYIRNKSQGIIMFVSINAHLPKSPELAAELADRLDTIQISMDGIGEVYEQVRLRGKYEFFDKNVRSIVDQCQGKRADLMFNFVAVKENYHQMADVVRYASEVGVKYVNITPFNIASATDVSLDYYEFFETDAFKSAMISAKNAADTVGNVEFTTWDFESEHGFQKCHFPWSHFYISWDGYTVPCCAKPFPQELHFGNVFEDGLLKSLNSSGYQHFREQWKRNETPEFCEKCNMVDMPSIKFDGEIQQNKPEESFNY